MLSWTCNFVIETILSTKWLKVLDTVLKDIKNHIGDVVIARVEFFLHFIYFSNEGPFGEMVGRTLGNVGKAGKNITSQTINVTQKDIMGARNINV